jgi:hypothetical protein
MITLFSAYYIPSDILMALKTEEYAPDPNSSWMSKLVSLLSILVGK